MTKKQLAALLTLVVGGVIVLSMGYKLWEIVVAAILFLLLTGNMPRLPKRKKKPYLRVVK